MVEADDRVKHNTNDRGGKTRYKVYRYPLGSVDEGIKTFYIPNSGINSDSSISETADVQRQKILTQTTSWSLDNPRTENTLVQRPESFPRAENLSLDNDRCTHEQTREFSQNGCIKNSYTSCLTSTADHLRCGGADRPIGSLGVGDRVRYVGRGENGLFTLKGIKTDVLTIVAIKDDHPRYSGVERAEVSSPKWITTQNIPIKDLQKV